MPHFDEALHPRGRATNAGQFRHRTNSAPDGELDSAPVDDTIALTLRSQWVERDVIPPRARNPRDIRHTNTLEVELIAVSAEEAPAGFEVTEWGWSRAGGEAEFIEKTRTVRVHDGRLYLPVLTRADEPVPADGPGAVDAIFRPGFDGVARLGEPTSLDDAQSAANDEVGRYLSIDGELWRATGEPVYRISTYGFGSNNGGTSLGVDFLPDQQESEYALDEFCFPAGDHSNAVDAAIKVAETRGDTESLKRIRETAPIVVTGEFQPASTYRPAPRLEYTSAASLAFESARSGDDQLVRREFDRLKAQLLAVPGAVVEVADGWGGQTKTINRRALTERQASDYDSFVRLTATVSEPL